MNPVVKDLITQVQPEDQLFSYPPDAGQKCTVSDLLNENVHFSKIAVDLPAQGWLHGCRRSHM